MSQISLSKPGAAPMAAMSLDELSKLVERELAKSAVSAFHGHVEARKIAETKIRDLTTQRANGSAALIEEMKALAALKKLIDAQRKVTGVSGVLEIALAAADEAYKAKGIENDKLLAQIAIEREACGTIKRNLAAIKNTPGWAIYVGHRGLELRRKAAEAAEAAALAAAKATIASGKTPDTDTPLGETVAEVLATVPEEPIMDETPVEVTITKTARRKANKAQPVIEIAETEETEEMPCHVKNRTAKGGDHSEVAAELYAQGMTPTQVHRALKEMQNA